MTASVPTADRGDGRSPAIELVGERNVLRLLARPPLTAAAALLSLPAILDVGARGRLLGVEIPVADAPGLAVPWQGSPGAAPGDYDAASATLYLAVDVEGEGRIERGDAHARGVAAAVRVLADAEGGLIAVEVPRRGPGWEIAYPSGNR